MLTFYFLYTKISKKLTCFLEQLKSNLIDGKLPVVPVSKRYLLCNWNAVKACLIQRGGGYH